MNREEATRILKIFLGIVEEINSIVQESLVEEAFEAIIKDLEQEPAEYIEGFKAGYLQCKFDLERETAKNGGII